MAGSDLMCIEVNINKYGCTHLSLDQDGQWFTDCLLNMVLWYSSEIKSFFWVAFWCHKTMWKAIINTNNEAILRRFYASLDAMILNQAHM